MIGDVDNDGKNEFVVATGDRVIRYNPSNGAYSNVWNATVNVRTVRIGDVDNDGNNELIAGGDKIYIYNFGATDITSPNLTITSPANGTTVSTSVITVSGTASDESGIANVTVNGILATGTTSWSADVTLAEGENTITVVATDNAGNSDTKTINITYAIPVPPTDIYVNPMGWWRSGGAFNASSTPIQAAVDNETAGEAICVYNGSYSENVDVNKTLTLQGEGADVVTVTAANSSDPVFEVRADWVNLSGFTVTGVSSQEGNLLERNGIYLFNVSHCNISNNIALNNVNGITLYKSNNNLIMNNTADHTNSDYHFPDGIILSISSYNMVTNNTVSNNADGIELCYLCHYNTITNNTVSSNTCGFYLCNYVKYNMFMNNTISSNSAGFRAVCGTYYTTFMNNIVTSNNEGIGVYQTYHNTFTNNIVSDNDGYGIRLCESFNTTFINNNISNNEVGIYLESSNSNIFYHNNLIDNIDSNANDDGSNTWDNGYPSGGNYWSDYNGTDSNSDGIGDTPYSIDGSAGAQDMYPLMQLHNGSSADTTPPSLTITSPANGTTVSTSLITVSGTASDESGIANVTVNGIPATGTTDWSADVTLAEGENTITVVATDNAGNNATKIITITVSDRVPGDVIGDDVVDIDDATLLFDWVSFPNERETTYVLNKPENADVTGNGVVNIGDAVLLFNWVSFPDERGTTYVLK